jgi:hypothetical protein
MEIQKIRDELAIKSKYFEMKESNTNKFCIGDGKCFQQKSIEYPQYHKNHKLPEVSCFENCKLKKCKGCNFGYPEWIFKTTHNEFLCIDCDINDFVVLQFGKYKGYNIEEIDDFSYLKFLAGEGSKENTFSFVSRKFPKVVEKAKRLIKNRCRYCEGTLVSIGNSRVNGAGHKDWNSRKYHKKCWVFINS